MSQNIEHIALVLLFIIAGVYDIRWLMVIALAISAVYPVAAGIGFVYTRRLITQVNAGRQSVKLLQHAYAMGPTHSYSFIIQCACNVAGIFYAPRSAVRCLGCGVL